MRSCLFLLSVSTIVCLACAPDKPSQVDPASIADEPVSHADEIGIWQARIERNANGFTGRLYISVGDQEWAVYDQALLYWISEDKGTIYWSYPHRKSGYEAEGQGLMRYQTESDAVEIVFEDDVMIVSVTETYSKSGRLALLVAMEDGAFGGPVVAVIDPDRGRVFREPFAKIVKNEDGVITVELYDVRDIAELDGRGTPEPTLSHDFDLDELLDREADREILFP